MQAKLIFSSAEEIARAKTMGITDQDRVYQLEDMARGHVMFVATGVTNGSFLSGVRFSGRGAFTHSIVMRSETGTVREIHTRHHFDRKPRYGW
jgi:fructose-1,6-bisphosphatase II